MKIASLSQSTLLAAGSALAVGAFGMWLASGYSFGTPRQIGPAVFPMGLSILLVAAGIGILLEGLLSDASRGDDPKPTRLIVVISVLGGPIAFALLIDRLGLVPAIFACVIISSVAERSLSLISVLALSAGLSVGCTLIFVSFLKLPLHPFVW